MNSIHLYLGIAGDGPVAHTSTIVPGTYAGHAVAGPQKLIEWLEQHLGLCGVFPSAIERAIALKTAIAEKKNESFFFSQSFKSDPLGVAKRLLVLWDSWLLSGWEPQSAKELPPRMATLAGLRNVFELCGPGLAGRTKAVWQHLNMASLPPLVVHLIDPPDYFPYGIQMILDKLQACVQHDYRDLQAGAPITTDLGRLQARLSGLAVNEPLKNDNTLQCVFFDNDIAEANAVYSLQLAANWKPVVVSQDSSLLNGLHVSQNHPVANWHTAEGNGQVSQLFFLATALFRRPANTSQIVAFLTAPISPLPKPLIGNLAAVFSGRPGFGNTDWNDTIADYLKELSGEPNEKRNKKRVEFWLKNKGFLKEPNLDVALLNDIYNQLGAWATQAVHYPSYELYTNQLANLSFLCTQLVRALKSEGESVAVSKFERLQAEIFTDVPGTIAHAEVGSADSFAAPGTIWAPCRELVWMNAIRFDPTTHLTRYWYQEEKSYFSKQGLPFHDESHAAAVYNFGLKRMVMNVRDRLVITIPAIAAGSPAAKPYCLDEWDQLISLEPVIMEKGYLLETIPWNTSTDLLEPHTRIVFPAPVPYFLMEEDAFQREKESYSSLEKLIQHPAEWYMDYRLKLRHTPGIDVPDSNVIKGVIADRVIQELFKEEHRQTTWWKAEADFLNKVEEVCDMILLQEGLPFLEKRTKRLLMEYKATLADSLRKLKAFVDDNGLTITATQFTVAGAVDNTPCEGFVDLLLKAGEKNIVIDLKWANSSRSYSDKLKTGSDLQLVLYAQLLDSKAASGYFMLNDGTAYMRNEKNNEGLKQVKYEEPLEDIDTAEIYQRAVNAIQYRRKELAEGKAEVGYDNPIEELEYHKDTEKLKLYALKDNRATKRQKQPPFADDFYLFFGKII